MYANRIMCKLNVCYADKLFLHAYSILAFNSNKLLWDLHSWIEKSTTLNIYIPDVNLNSVLYRDFLTSVRSLSRFKRQITNFRMSAYITLLMEDELCQKKIK